MGRHRRVKPITEEERAHILILLMQEIQGKIIAESLGCSERRVRAVKAHLTRGTYVGNGAISQMKGGPGAEQAFAKTGEKAAS